MPTSIQNGPYAPLSSQNHHGGHNHLLFSLNDFNPHHSTSTHSLNEMDLAAGIQNSSSSGSGGGGGDHQHHRTMQLAMELALLQQGHPQQTTSSYDISPTNGGHPLLTGQNSQPLHHSSSGLDPNNPLLHPFGISSCNGIGGSLEDLKTRRSQNMTECVPVPTSEHVAEIVGRQGKPFSARFFSFYFIRSLVFVVGYRSPFLSVLSSPLFLSPISIPLLLGSYSGHSLLKVLTRLESSLAHPKSISKRLFLKH